MCDRVCKSVCMCDNGPGFDSGRNAFRFVCVVLVVQINEQVELEDQTWAASSTQNLSSDVSLLPFSLMHKKVMYIPSLMQSKL